MARIKAAADSALAAAASPAAALLLKDFLLLACTALSECSLLQHPFHTDSTCLQNLLLPLPSMCLLKTQFYQPWALQMYDGLPDVPLA